MKNPVKILMLMTVIMSLAFLVISAKSPDKPPKWVAPAKVNTLKNPYSNQAAITSEGKALYEKLCAACHGNKGKGDGPAGVSLNPRPGSFTTVEFQNQSDGAIFWKITYGRPPMAAYEKILTEKQRWALVNYLRTFKSKK